MHRYLPAFVALMILSVALMRSGADDRSNSQATLPGAIPRIDASTYPTLQAALDAVGEQGGLVQLPAGVFELQEPLVIRRGDVTIEGCGTATHLKNVNQDGKPAIVLAAPEHDQQGNDRERELWRIHLSNFRVTGNPQSGHGIIAHNINELFIQGVTSSYHGGDGIHLNHCYEDPRIIASLITYNVGTGLNLLGCHDIVVSANQFEENQDGVHCFDGFNLCMTGNCLDDHLGSGVVIENTYGSVVSGNMIEECQGAALIMDRDCYGNTVSANVIAHNGSGVELRDAHGCAVCANTMTIMKSSAVLLSSQCSRIAVCANCVSDSYIGEGTHKRSAEDRLAAGMTVARGVQSLISSNVFSGVGPQGIVLEQDARNKESGFIVDNLFLSNEPGVEAAPIDSLEFDGNRASTP